MTTLPIVARELVVASRRRATYWMRFAAATSGLLIFLVPCAVSRSSLTDVGQGVFIFLGALLLLFSMLAGVFLTADSLSVEKREGTLGLLFLTDLKGYDVVLGKLAANSLHSFFGLLAVFPVLALPLLTGGVSGGEFWRAVLVFMMAMYVSLGVGMLISAASHEGRQAMGGTFAAMTFLAAVLPVFWLWQTNINSRGYLDFLLWPSPVYAYIKSFDDSYLTFYGPRTYWRSLMILFAIGTGCILAASFLLPRTWQKVPAAPLARRLKRIPFFTKPLRRRPPLENVNPFLWLALGDRGGQAMLNRMIVALGLCWAGMMALSADRSGMYLSFAFFLAFGLHFAVKTLIASESGRRFHQDRQSGALELVLATPLQMEDVVAGQRKALGAQFKWAVWALGAVNVATFLGFMAVSLIGSARMQAEEFTMSLEIFCGGTCLIWLDTSALIWLGMWRGLTGRKYARSVLATWGQVMGPPWLVIFFLLFISMVEPGIGQGTVQGFLFLWILVGVLVDLAVITWARGKLETSLRAVVSETYQG